MKNAEKKQPNDDPSQVRLHKSAPRVLPAPNEKSNSVNHNIKETGGFENQADPTRYGDWELAGRCIDF